MESEDMAKAITNTTQLSTYSIIKNILKTSTVLNTKFKDYDYYDFEPNTKSVSFKGYPLIWINSPSTDTKDNSINRKTTEKDFTISIKLSMNYEARAKFIDYANAIVNQIEQNDSTLLSAGYYLKSVDLEEPFTEYEKDNYLVSGIISVILEGVVSR